MDVLGMHAEVNRLVQSKLSTYAIEEVNQYEIDAALNKAVLTFLMENFNPISNRLQQGFEQTKIRNAQLTNLVVSNHPLSPSVEGNVVSAALPSNCMWFLSTRSEVWYNCRVLPQTTTVSKRICFIPFLPSAVNMPTYTFEDFNMTVNHDGDTTSFDPVNNLQSYVYPYDYISFVSDYITNFKEQGFELYYESYKNIYKQNTFILVTTNNIYDSVTITYSEDNAETFDFETVTFTDFLTTNLNKSIITNRFGPQDDVWLMNEDPFNWTEPDSPLSYESEKKIHVLFNNTFAIKSVLLNYIKFPRQISLNLNQSCELSVAFHPTICRMAATEILEIVTSRRYETSLSVKNE